MSEVTQSAKSVSTRAESDSMGTIEVTTDRYWGAQTPRSLIHFAIGKEPCCRVSAPSVFSRRPLRCSTGSRQAHGEKADLITQGGRRGDRGQAPRAFSLRIWQTGSGTKTNMNVNEVISNRAIQWREERWEQEARPSQRRREHVAIVQPHLPHRDVHRGGHEMLPPLPRGQETEGCLDAKER